MFVPGAGEGGGGSKVRSFCGNRILLNTNNAKGTPRFLGRRLEAAAASPNFVRP